MPRLPLVDVASFPEEYRSAMSDAHITRTLANSPAVAFQSGRVARYIRNETRVAPRLRELALIQVGYSAPNAYEYVHHIEIGLASGVSEADIDALAAEAAGKTTGLDPLTRAVLSAAREMTLSGKLADDTFATLRGALGNRDLVDLLFAIANYIGISRLLSALEVEIEDQYQPVLARFPLAG